VNVNQDGRDVDGLSTHQRIGTDIVEGISELESETDSEEVMSMIESGKLIISPLDIELEFSVPESPNLD
jgi:hypothetical protein